MKGFARRNGAAAQATSATDAPTDLARRRDELANAFWEAQSDLGGLVYEMACRDQFRMDLIVRHAARLRELHAELAEVERLLRLEQAAAAGSCGNCGALYAHGAAYCWQCGQPLTAPPTAEQATVAS